jgi:hypothetical protein
VFVVVGGGVAWRGVAWRACAARVQCAPSGTRRGSTPHTAPDARTRNHARPRTQQRAAEQVPDTTQPPPGYDIHAEIKLEVPVEHGLLIENLLDLAHAPFTHQRCGLRAPTRLA